MRLSVEQRIVADMELGPRGCWVFTGPRDENGYGRIKVGGRSVRTHRLMFEHHKGGIPYGLRVLHECDNPPCCNPAHLRLGTQLDNIADATRKRRMRGRGAWTHCLRGHEFTIENTIIQANGARCCRTCRQNSPSRRKSAQ